MSTPRRTTGAVLLASVLAVLLLWSGRPAAVRRGAAPAGRQAGPVLAVPAPLPAALPPPAPAALRGPVLRAPQRARGLKLSDRRVRTLLLRDEPPPGASAGAAARRSLEIHEQSLARAGWTRSLALTDLRPAAGGTVARFQQESRGLPVLGGGATVLLDGRGRTLYASARELPGLPASVDAAPSVDSAGARRAAEGDFEVEEGVASEEPTLYVVPTETSAALAWVVPVHTEEPFGSFLVQVDAHTAEVLESQDILKTATGKGAVYRPNPVASSGNFDLRDNFDRLNEALDQARVEVDLPDLDESGFLRGTLVDVVTGDSNDRVKSDSLQFSFQRNDPGFEQTSCYYYLQFALAYCGTIGRPDPLERQLRAQARFSPRGEEELNAFFDPASGNVLFGTQGVDLAEDGTVVLHELGHALQDAAASQPGRPFGLTHEGQAIGEGFSDYWAVSLLEEQLLHEPRFIAHWISYGDLDYPFGQALFAGLHRRVDSDKVWPRDADPTRDPHLDGEIWSAALWRIRDLLGRDSANRLILEAHYLLQPEAQFQEASLAILAANSSLFGDAHQAEISAILHDRGVYDPDGTSSQDDRFEENDTPEEAADVLLGQSSASYTDLVLLDDDWYVVRATAGELVDLRIDFVHENGDLDLSVEVLDPQKLELVNVGVSAGEENVEHLAVNTGGVVRSFADENGDVFLFFFVSGFQGSTNNYALTISKTAPSTDEQVTELALGDTFEGTASGEDVDVVQFEGLAGMKISLQTRRKGAAGSVVAARLVGDSGAIFDFGEGLTARGLKQTVTLPSTGIYNLFLRAANGTTGPYALKLKGKAPRATFKENIFFATEDEFTSFDLEALAGSTLTLKVKARGKNPDGTRLQPLAGWFDGDGNLVAASGASPGETSTTTTLFALETGTYFGVATPSTGSSGGASISARVKLPRSKRVLQERID